MLVKCYIKEIEKIEAREGSKSCPTRQRIEGEHEINKIKRTVDMKIIIEDNNRCNIATMRMKLKIVSSKR